MLFSVSFALWNVLRVKSESQSEERISVAKSFVCGRVGGGTRVIILILLEILRVVVRVVCGPLRRRRGKRRAFDEMECTLRGRAGKSCLVVIREESVQGQKVIRYSKFRRIVIPVVVESSSGQVRFRFCLRFRG